MPEDWRPKQTTQGGTEGRGVCRDLDKPGGCQWGARCRYVHPEGRGRSSENKTKDFFYSGWEEAVNLAKSIAKVFTTSIQDKAAKTR